MVYETVEGLDVITYQKIGLKLVYETVEGLDAIIYQKTRSKLVYETVEGPDIIVYQKSAVYETVEILWDLDMMSSYI